MPFREGDFNTRLNEIKTALKRKLPVLAGAEAELFFIMNFRLQGWQGDNGLEPWPKRAHGAGGDRNILRQTGKLRQGIQKQVTEKTVRVAVTGAAMKYADAHNFGETIHVQVTAKMKSWAWAMYYQTLDARYKAMALQKEGTVRTIVIPQRKFIGNSKQLDARLQAIFEKTIGDIANK